MFKKLVAEVSRSPSSVVELGKFATHLHRQRRIYSLALIFLILTLVAHSYTLLNPSTSSNTAHADDTIPGGVSSQEELLERYDQNESNIADIFTTLQISRPHLEQLTSTKVALDDQLITGRTPLVSPSRGERLYETDSWRIYTRLATHIHGEASKTHRALAGSHTYGDFYILLDSGNVVLSTSFLLPSTGDDINVNITSHNNIQSLADAIAQPGDRITYTLHASTEESFQGDYTHYIGDALEYSELISYPDAAFMTEEATLVYPSLSLNEGETTILEYEMRVFDHVPSTATGISAPQSYDCIMQTAGSNYVAIEVHCPLTKRLEHIVNGLPHISPFTSTLALLGLFVGVLYLYLRARLLDKELRILRHTINTGGF